MIEVKKAKYVNDYKIEITFNDDKVGTVDFENLIFNDKRGIFLPLQDLDFFKNFTVDYTLIWSRDLDIAPEFLYFKAFENDNDLQERFQQWGYAA